MGSEETPAGWYPSPTDYRGEWMSYWDGEDWSPIPPRLASRKEREQFDWPKPPPPADRPTLDSLSEVLVEDAVLLGGFGFPLVQNSVCDLEFDDETVTVSGHGATGLERIPIPLTELTSLSIGGAGAIREGGGFAGGGFGLEGFAIGATVAGLLNAATTKHRIETIIGLQADHGELIFLCTTIAPQPLELSLARQRSVVRRREQSAGDGSAGSSEASGLAQELAQLADLVDRGFLDRDEFEQAKSRLLGSGGAG